MLQLRLCFVVENSFGIIKKLMQLIERESGNWKLEMLQVEKMKKAKHLAGKLQAASLESTIYQSMNS